MTLPDGRGMKSGTTERNLEQLAIMFITTLAQYAIQGYEVDAADYVLKPVEYLEVDIIFQLALKRVIVFTHHYKSYISLYFKRDKDCCIATSISKIQSMYTCCDLQPR